MVGEEALVKNCYFGVFGCYSPNRGVVRTLVMSGDFTHLDLYRVHIKLVEDGVLKPLVVPWTSDCRFFSFSLFFVGLGCLIGILAIPLNIFIFIVYCLFKRLTVVEGS